MVFDAPASEYTNSRRVQSAGQISGAGFSCYIDPPPTYGPKLSVTFTSSGSSGVITNLEPGGTVSGRLVCPNVPPGAGIAVVD
jgi:hypothetical protein